MGHLGSRVSALLDGQLSALETERAWGHVHLCHVCRDAVEREGWVKTRLSALGGAPAPSHLKGTLLAPLMDPPPGPAYAAEVEPRRRTGRPVLLGLTGSAAGVAVIGVVALGLTAGPDRPLPDRRAPVTNLSGTELPGPLPSRPPVRRSP